MVLIFERQWLHLLALAILLPALTFALRFESLTTGELWGVTTSAWLWCAVACAILHQVMVWFFWRTELHRGFISRAFGKASFPLYAALFAILGITRTLLVFTVAYANRGTLTLPVLPMKVLAIILLIPALYLFYSVRRYFGFRRALGIDHFDAPYRGKPFVKQGIFRFTSNGMYTYGFLILWAPAFWWGSTAAIAAALFNHIYIWVHYYATELPDIRRIYGKPA